MKTPEEGGGGPSNGLMGMSSWQGPIFTTGLTITTYSKVAFSTELLLDFVKVLRFSFPVPVT